MMRLKIFQKGFNYSQDGQGNRLVYHLQGCNMKCKWCANPEGMPMDGVIFADKEKFRPSCSYEEQTIEEVFEDIMGCSPMFFDGGGVTFSGGEATMQFESLKELLIRLKDAGIHTAVETNGSHPRLPELFPYIDQLIMDCKHWSPEKHKEFTGVEMEHTLKNLKLAAELHNQLDVRIPLIGGVNNSEEDMKEFVRLFQSFAGENVTFEILKYHEFGKKKWEECGWAYEMTDEANVTYEEIRRFRETISNAGLQYKRS